MADWIVETRDLCRIYGDGAAIRALDGVNLCVARGEVVAVMGPSGSGKSTLLNLIGALDLPITDVTASLAREDFYAPGSILRLQLDTTSALAAGMPAQSIAWVESGPAFDVQDPTRVRVVGRFPADSSAVLLSGWLLGAGRLAGKAALVEAQRGRGRAILFGFRPQYRGQSLATYPLLFNALREAAR